MSLVEQWFNDWAENVTYASDDNRTPAANRSGWQRFRRTTSRLIDHPLTGELFGIDVRGLAIFRVCLAVLLLLDLAGRVPFLTQHYTDAGLVTRDLMIGRISNWKLSLYWMNGTTAFVAVMFLVAAAFALLLLVGYRTRLATVVSWVLLISLHYRNPLVGSAGDHVMRLLLFWGMFLPLGACGSVDSRLRGDDAIPRNSQSVLSMATLGLLLQISFIYMFSVVMKTSPIWRQDGTAIYYALSLDRMVTPLGRWMVGFHGLCRAMTFATLGLEAAGPLLAFIPFGTRYLRTVAVFMFIGFHLGLALTMHLILFPFVCMAAWVVFLPPWFWDRLAATRFVATIADTWQIFIDGISRVVRRLKRGEIVPVQSRSPYRSGLLLNLMAGICLLYVLGWNVHSVTKKPKPALPRFARKIGLNETAIDTIAGIGSTFGISQGWIMFSPYPPRDDGWWVAEATLADGSQVDLYREGRPVGWEKPTSIPAEFPSHRCRKYMMSMWTGKRRYHAPHYARWIREQWDETHVDERSVVSLRLYFMLEYTQPPGQPPLIAKLLVFRWSDDDGERLVSHSANKKEYRRLLDDLKD